MDVFFAKRAFENFANKYEALTMEQEEHVGTDKQYQAPPGETYQRMVMEFTRPMTAFEILLSFAISIGAVFLVWNCNAQSKGFDRFIATLFDFFFSGLYLLYYFIRYILIGDTCGPSSRNSNRNTRNRGSNRRNIQNRTANATEIFSPQTR